MECIDWVLDSISLFLPNQETLLAKPPRAQRIGENEIGRIIF